MRYVRCDNNHQCGFVDQKVDDPNYPEIYKEHKKNYPHHTLIPYNRYDTPDFESE